MDAPLDNTAIDALRGELCRSIDRQTDQLSGRLDSLCTFLSIATVAILIGFVLLAVVLYGVFNRLPAE